MFLKYTTATEENNPWMLETCSKMLHVKLLSIQKKKKKKSDADGRGGGGGDGRDTWCA